MDPWRVPLLNLGLSAQVGLQPPPGALLPTPGGSSPRLEWTPGNAPKPSLRGLAGPYGEGIAVSISSFLFNLLP